LLTVLFPPFLLLGVDVGCRARSNSVLGPGHLERSARKGSDDPASLGIVVDDIRIGQMAADGLARGWKPGVCAREDDTVPAIFGRNDDRAVPEAGPDAAHERGKGHGIVAQIGYQQPAPAEALSAAVVEGPLAQRRGKAPAVKAVENEDVGRAGGTEDIVQVIGADYAEPSLSGGMWNCSRRAMTAGSISTTVMSHWGRQR